MKYIEDMNIKNKKVVLRLDLNVPISKCTILDDTKIKESLKTINYLIDNGCKVLMLSHLGKIKSKEDMEVNSLKIVADRLSTLLNKDVKFIDNPIDPKIPKILDEYDLVLLENTRFMDYPEKLESSCDLNLASFWASAGEIFINDAFGTSHRKHASNYGISKFLETGYGFLFKKELDGLKPIIGEEITRPFVVIMGGAKVDDKIELINSLLKKCDYLLLGGGIANTFLKAKDINVGKSLINENVLDDVKKTILNYSEKIILPIDVITQFENNVYNRNLDEIHTDDVIYDIGKKTVDEYKKYLDKAKTIFVNGTMGLYENENFSAGTKEILSIIGNENAIKIAGGGDAVSSINKFNLADTFDFLSTGGGATLKYIISEKIECFEDNNI